MRRADLDGTDCPAPVTWSRRLDRFAERESERSPKECAPVFIIGIVTVATCFDYCAARLTFPHEATMDWVGLRPE